MRRKRCARRVALAANIAPAMAEVSSENAGGERREAILTAAARVIARSGSAACGSRRSRPRRSLRRSSTTTSRAARVSFARRRARASDKAPPRRCASTPAPAPGTKRSRPPYWRSSTRRTVRDNAIVWGEVSATAVFEPELRADVKRVTDTWSATVADAIRRGIGDGSIRNGTDPDQAAEMLITLVDGLCNRWLAGAMERERHGSCLSQPSATPSRRPETCRVGTDERALGPALTQEDVPRERNSAVAGDRDDRGPVRNRARCGLR